MMSSNTKPQPKGGTKVIIIPVVNVEVYTNLSTAPAIQPHLRPPCNSTPAHAHSKSTSPHFAIDFANGGWRRYGNVRGLRRLKWLFEERLGSQIGRRGAWTAVVNCQALRSEKDVRDVLFGLTKNATSGFELACHGWDNSTPNTVDGYTMEDEATYIRRCLFDLEVQRSAYYSEQQQLDGVSLSSTVHPKVETWLTPGFKGSVFTADAARMAGVRTLLDFCDDDFPYFYAPERQQHCISDGLDKTFCDPKIATSFLSGDEQLVCVPYSMEMNDFSLVLEMKYDNRQYARTLVDHIRQLAIEAEMDDGEIGRGKGDRVVCLGVHTFVAGQPARVKALGDAFETLLKEFGEDRLYFATVKEVGNRLREQISSPLDELMS